MNRCVFALLGLGLMASPAFAGEFYIVRHHDAKECVIVETKPHDVEIIIGDHVYDTHDEAFAQLAIVCADHHVDHHKKPVKKYDY